MRDYENSRSSQGLVVEFSAATCSDGARSALSSGTPTPRAFLPPDRTTAFSRPSRFGMTFGPLTESLGAELLTWFREASRARTSALPERARASTASDPACGPKWRASLATYDPATCSWRTAQLSLLGDLGESSVTWPRWGTTVAGELFLLPQPALPTSGSESGSWPTPRAQDAKHGAATEWELSTDHAGTRDSLRVQIVKRMWATPNASDNRDRGNMSDPSIQRRLAIGKQIGLSMQVKESAGSGSLNPTWVEWLMGWPLGWTDLQPLATAKSLNAPPLRGAA